MNDTDSNIEYERWLNDNVIELQDVFNDKYNFQEFIEEAWKEYKEENKPIDKIKTGWKK